MRSVGKSTLLIGIGSLIGIGASALFLISSLREITQQMFPPHKLHGIFRFDHLVVPLPRAEPEDHYIVVTQITQNDPSVTRTDVTFTHGAPKDSAEETAIFPRYSVPVAQLVNCWTGYVVNDNEYKVTGVQFRAPFWLAWICPDDGTQPYYLPQSEVVVLPELAPQQRVGVTLWSRGANLQQGEIPSLDQGAPFRTDQSWGPEPTRLTHDSGVGDIMVYDHNPRLSVILNPMQWMALISVSLALTIMLAATGLGFALAGRTLRAKPMDQQGQQIVLRRE